jgi:hypothetical protein
MGNNVLHPDSDPHGSVLILVGWILIRIENANPDLGRQNYSQN